MKIKLKKCNIEIVYYWVFAIAVIPFLTPYYFLQHETIGPLIDDWMYLSIFILMVYVIVHYRKISSQIIIVLVMYALLLCVTIVNNGEIFSVVKHLIKLILLCCVIDTLKENDKLMITLLYVIRDITFFLFLANFVTCIIWNNGIPSITQNVLFPYYLFGNVNTTIRVALPGMLCSTLVNHKNNKKFNLISLIYLAGYIYIFLKVYPTTTTLIAILIITIWIMFENILKKQYLQIYFLSICAVLTMELVLVVLPNTNIIGFITGFFNKSSDFSGRSFLWSRAMSMIREHPFWGVGKQSIIELKTAIGNSSGSHNYYLDILYQRGIAGIVLFLSLILKPIIGMKKSNGETNSVIYILSGYCICLLVMFLSEPFYEYEYYFIPIFYALHVCARENLKLKGESIYQLGYKQNECEV